MAVGPKHYNSKGSAPVHKKYGYQPQAMGRPLSPMALSAAAAMRRWVSSGTSSGLASTLLKAFVACLTNRGVAPSARTSSPAAVADADVPIAIQICSLLPPSSPAAFPAPACVIVYSSSPAVMDTCCLVSLGAQSPRRHRSCHQYPPPPRRHLRRHRVFSDVGGAAAA